MSNIDQELAEAVSESISSVNVDWPSALKAMEEQDYGNEAYKVASKAVMEPELSDEAFEIWEKWTNDQMDSWIAFIRNTTEGDPNQTNWIKVAEFVKENGY